MKRNSKIKVFYTSKQVLTDKINQSYSKSPLKPKLLMEQFGKLGFDKHLEVVSDFEPFNKEDFMVAHTEKYVDAVFNGTSGCESNNIPWSPMLAQTVRYTNASLYNAIKSAVTNPSQICFSPTSGFHHARPTAGSGFCTFSGQVIASTKIYRELGLSGAYIDLDGHFGNSIEDSRYYVPDLDKAIPVGNNTVHRGSLANINPVGNNESYLQDLSWKLHMLEKEVAEGRVHYVVLCHGADSHEWDDLGGQVDTEHWVKCSEMFYAWVKLMDKNLGRPLPVVLSLFGGYRKNSYESVLNLHTKDFVTCLNVLCGKKIDFELSTSDNIRDTRIAGTLKLGKMTQNENEILEFFTKHTCPNFHSGIYVGQAVKGWKNHSMAKWCNKLVKRGFLSAGKTTNDKKGFKLKLS